MPSNPEVSAMSAAQGGAPERNNAQFRALREMVGISHADLARAVNVNPRTVRRWEIPDAYVPDDVWEYLESARARQVEVCGFSIRKVLSMESEMGGRPDVIAIPYHGDGTDRANARLVAHELVRRGFSVRFVPEE